MEIILSQVTKAARNRARVFLKFHALHSHPRCFSRGGQTGGAHESTARLTHARHARLCGGRENLHKNKFPGDRITRY